MTYDPFLCCDIQGHCMKIEQAIKEYLKEIEVRKYTPKTIRSYRNNLSLFLLFCESVGVTDTEDITLAVVKDFSLYMGKRGCKGTYINSLLKTSKSFIQYIYDEEYGGFNTRAKYRWCKEDKPVIRAFTPEQVQQMLSNCKGRDYIAVRDRCILTMLFETGIRCWELCCIQNPDIHDSFIIINGKNHKQRVVPVTHTLGKAMRRHDNVKSNYFLVPKCDYYFLSFHGNPLTNSAVEHIVKRYGEGIEGVRVSPHTCRHFFAQQQVKMGTDLYTISRLLGHENIAITQTYLNSLRDEDIIQLARQKSVLENLKGETK